MTDTINTIKTKCGYAVIVGRPNVGKSTLLNLILGHKLQIVTPKPQTTRNQVLAIFNKDNSQIVFLDTPGLHKSKHKLGDYMNESVASAISNADVIIWIIDVDLARNKTKENDVLSGENRVLKQLENTQKPVIILLNKIDKIRDKTLIIPWLTRLSELENVTEIIPVSCKKKDGIQRVINAIEKQLPVSPTLYPNDMLSDKSDRFFICEMVREAVIGLTREEIPYRTAVTVDRFVEETQLTTIHATIHVEKPSQKGIIIGKGGQLIKEIGTRAREEIITFLDRPIELLLHVNVTDSWTQHQSGLKKMGYK